MDASIYQREAMRTKDQSSSGVEQFKCSALGIAGESGEICELVKKLLYHHKMMSKQQLVQEMGDLLWYIALMADAIEVDLSEIMSININKLRLRYPNGFSYMDSQIRRDVNGD